MSLKVVNRKAANKKFKSSQTTIDYLCLIMVYKKGILVKSFSRVTFVGSEKICCKK